ncbi:MAG TPA: EAL domain-containing protein [Burkholderiaceae bacterium]|nr:EAL domain-containing protein [Burkholderiaceae bacterium]
MTQTGDELAQTLKEHQVILENASIGISFIQQRTIVRCNQRFAEIYGHASPATVLGVSSLSLYPSVEAFEQLGAAAYPQLATGKAYRTRIQMVRRDGSLFWCSLTSKLIDPSLPDLGSVWIVEDVDELIQSEQSLALLVTEQSLILEHALVGIVFLKNRLVTRCNRLFEETFGYGPGELNGGTSRQWYLSDEDWLAAGQQCYAPLVRGETFRAEMRLGKRDGTPIWCDVLAKAIDPSDMGKGSIWITLDITARKAAEEALAQAYANLEHQVALRTRELSETVQNLHHEIAERRAMERKIEHLALHDTLTDLPNRRYLERSLAQAMADARARAQQVAVLFLDLDRFKHFNDAFGHTVGDELLQAVASRLAAAVPAHATLSRQGGDEFVIVLPAVASRGDVTACVQQIAQALKPLVVLGSREARVTCSIGISLYPDDGLSADALLKHADMAMFQAKHKGQGSFQFFNARLDVELQRRMALEQALHDALQAGSFELHYQPQVEVSTGRLTGVEALMRWHRPGLGWEPPGHFIPVAEDIGLIGALGMWALQQACRQVALWLQAGWPPIRVAVNVSALQLDQPDFVSNVLQALADNDLPAACLELELTEGVMLRDMEATHQTLVQLHEAGIAISIDDFGTGYSSLSYLSRLPLDKLKIDRSFVKDIDTRPSDAVLCRTIVAMARNLGLHVTAEGVETESQLRMLSECGCTHYQGYLFSRPVPAEQVSALLAQQVRRVSS